MMVTKREKRRFYLIDLENGNKRIRITLRDIINYFLDTTDRRIYVANLDFIRYSREMDEVGYRFIIENPKGDEFYPYPVDADGGISYGKEEDCINTDKEKENYMNTDKGMDEYILDCEMMYEDAVSEICRIEDEHKADPCILAETLATALLERFDADQRVFVALVAENAYPPAVSIHKSKEEAIEFCKKDCESKLLSSVDSESPEVIEKLEEALSTGGHFSFNNKAIATYTIKELVIKHRNKDKNNG